MDNKNNMDECMWMIMGSIHESDRITVAKCLDMMEEKGISKKEMISIIENAKVELFHVYNEKIRIFFLLDGSKLQWRYCADRQFAWKSLSHCAEYGCHR